MTQKSEQFNADSYWTVFMYYVYFKLMKLQHNNNAFFSHQLSWVRQHVRRHQLHGHQGIQAVSGQEQVENRRSNITSELRSVESKKKNLITVPWIRRIDYKIHEAAVSTGMSQRRQLLFLSQGIHEHRLLGTWVAFLCNAISKIYLIFPCYFCD